MLTLRNVDWFDQGADIVGRIDNDCCISIKHNTGLQNDPKSLSVKKLMLQMLQSKFKSPALVQAARKYLSPC